ncbi:class I SAM-dependent methyltransferase [Patescibacteria group bacterium]|nr:class I SAM-dependent methyltransferase [Patescibacteria group bacterium]MCG2692769.1 class I SAM-dependent methyltransferase [Candidatus Parcubacteria bacterium]
MKHWNTIYKKEGDKYEYYKIFEPHKDIGRVVRIFKKHKIKKILDLGCGAGRHVWYLAKQGFDVYGIDIASDGIKKAKAMLKQKKLKANLKVGDIYTKLPYQDNFFDAIVNVQVIQHGKEKQIKYAIKEIERILKPGGLAFFTVCGRTSKGKVRYCLVKTAKKIAPNTYVPTIGNETGLTHFIYTKQKINEHFKNFKLIDSWRDDKDYYCFTGRKD